MKFLEIAKQLTQKDSPIKKLMGLNKAGATKADALAVVMGFIKQEQITRIIDSIHKEYQRQLAIRMIPPGHVLEIRLLPDLQKKQLKILVEDCAPDGSRTAIFELLSRSITRDTIEHEITNLMGGAGAMAEPFKIDDLIPKQQ